MSYVVEYRPAKFPNVITSADLIDGDGELLIVNPGWGYKLISVGQVERIITARQQERSEQVEIKMEEYEREERR